MKPETRSFYEAAVQRAVERVVSGLDEALDLDALARACGLSAFHFHRIFRGMIGETPLELHRRLRMERAALSLRDDADRSVTQIALEAGYDTHEAFTRAFRARYGCPPSEFRQGPLSKGDSCVRPRQLALRTPSGIHYESLLDDPPSRALVQRSQSMTVEIRTMPALRAATVRHVGAYNRISEAFARLGEQAGRAGLTCGRSPMIAIYHDDPETTPEHELRSDAAIVVPEEALLPDTIGEHRLPAGRWACALHVGPYEHLGDAWARLMGQWLPASGERLGNGSSYELYVNHPGEAAQQDLRTELYVHLATTVLV